MIFSYLLNMQSHPSWVCGLKHACCWLSRWDGVSHPSWVCGLKLQRAATVPSSSSVTPFVGVWIETVCAHWLQDKADVTPFVGVWIETSKLMVSKQTTRSHTLRGCVD